MMSLGKGEAVQAAPLPFCFAKKKTGPRDQREPEENL